MRVFAAVLVLSMMCACSTKSDVVPTGKNGYVVRPLPASDVKTDPEIKAFGIKRANEYCDAKGQHAIVTIAETTNLQPFSVQRAEVRFTCIDK
jgi:hypothetical protein